MKTEIKEKKHTPVNHNHKLLTGVTSDKYAILLDDGKTIVFISDKNNEAEPNMTKSVHFDEQAYHHILSLSSM